MNCPTCGMKVKIVGKTTMHYEPDFPRVEEIAKKTYIFLAGISVGLSAPIGWSENKQKLLEKTNMELATAIHQMIKESVDG